MQSGRTNQIEGEIDLADIFRMIRKRIKIIYTIMAISILSGLGYNYTTVPVFKSEFIVNIPRKINQQTSIISVSEVASMIQVLDEMRKEKMYDNLANKLSIPVNEAMSLKKLSTKLASGAAAEKSISIIIQVDNPALINNFKKGLVNYLNKNKYINRRLSLELQQVIAIKEKVEGKLDELIRLKRNVIGKINSNHINYLGFNPLDMESTILTLQNQVIQLNKEIQMSRGFEILVEPIVPTVPNWPDRPLMLLITSMTGLFFGVVAAIALEKFR